MKAPDPVCAWCRKKMDPNGDVIMVGIPLRWELHRMAKRDAGKTIYLDIPTLGRSAMAFIPRPWSKAKRKDGDIQFPTCRISCAKALDATLDDERNLIKAM